VTLVQRTLDGLLLEAKKGDKHEIHDPATTNPIDR
jgi:hypothetical protein